MVLAAAAVAGAAGWGLAALLALRCRRLRRERDAARHVAATLPHAARDAVARFRATIAMRKHAAEGLQENA